MSIALPRMRPTARKTALTAHVVLSVGWLGLDLGLLTLGLTALVSGDPTTTRAAYVAMDLLGGTWLVVVALGSLATGLLVSLGTHWGLVRHRWVLTKLVLTMGAATATVFALRPGLHEAATRAAATPAGAQVDVGDVAVQLAIAPSVALVLYLTMTVLSVFKPWGRTRWGRSGN
jgi:hypothetical protein